MTSPVVKLDGVEALRRGQTIELQDLIEPRELVTYHSLVKLGKKPESILVRPARHERFNASGGIDGISLGANADGNDIMSLPPEDLYILLAHETRHMAHSLRERKGGHLLGGADEEDETRIWEAMQATKYEWDEHDYEAFVRRLVKGAQRAGDIPYHTARQEIRERLPQFFAVRRRPVAVQQYRRRR